MAEDTGRILIAVDFSRPSRQALEAGARLAEDLGVGVLLVHAYSSPPRFPDVGHEHIPAPITQLRVEISLDEALELSTEWAQGLRGRGLDVETEAREGPPAQVVLEAARRHDAAMLVVGTHGWRGLRRLVLGSVAQGVVKGADRPVLVVPAPGPDAAGRP